MTSSTRLATGQWQLDHADTALGLPPTSGPPPTAPAITWDASSHGLDYPLVADQPWADMRTTTVFAPDRERGDWAYNHHAYMRTFDGVLYLMHSQCPVMEDVPGNRLIMWTSGDRGDSWAGPYTVVDGLDTPTGYDDPDMYREGRVVYSGQWLQVAGQVYALGMVDWCGRMTHRKSPQPRLGLGYIARAVSADGPTGEPFWIGAAPDSAPGAICHPGADPTGGALLRALRQPLDFPSYGSVPCPDNRLWCNAYVDAPDWKLINPATCKLPDDSYLRLYRNVARDADGRVLPACHRMAARRSCDGSTWSPPVYTAIPTSPMFPALLRLSNGRYAYANNLPGKRCRDPLVLAFSDDMQSFAAQDIYALRRDVPTTPRYPGAAKGGGAQQCSMAEVDGRLVVAYSIAKEDIAVTSIAVPAVN